MSEHTEPSTSPAMSSPTNSPVETTQQVDTDASLSQSFGLFNTRDTNEDLAIDASSDSHFPNSTTTLATFLTKLSASRELSTERSTLSIPGDHSPDRSSTSFEAVPEEETLTLSENPQTAGTKTKRVKYHTCPICEKLFPRPSALKTHMNIHNNEKPFPCCFPGCTKSFSVESNAKRHLRTHDTGEPSMVDMQQQPAQPYVVGFETPLVIDHGVEASEVGSSSNKALRWMPVKTNEASNSLQEEE